MDSILIACVSTWWLLNSSRVELFEGQSLHVGLQKRGTSMNFWAEIWIWLFFLSFGQLFALKIKLQNIHHYLLFTAPILELKNTGTVPVYSLFKMSHRIFPSLTWAIYCSSLKWTSCLKTDITHMLQPLPSPGLRAIKVFKVSHSYLCWIDFHYLK